MLDTLPSKGPPRIISSNSHDNLGSRLCYFPYCFTDKETETQPFCNLLKVTVIPCHSWDLSPSSLTRDTAHYPLGEIVREKVVLLLHLWARSAIKRSLLHQAVKSAWCQAARRPCS